MDSFTRGYEVPPLGRKDIRRTADTIRRVFQIDETKPFPVMKFLEQVMPMLFDSFNYEVLSEKEMGEAHGRSFPNNHVIHLREDVYDRACEGYGRDRLTVMHEISHQFLHEGVSVSLARTRSLPAFKDSEWQANALAGEILMPYRQIRAMSQELVVATYDVTPAAAATQLRTV